MINNKDDLFHQWHEHGTKKNSESLTGIEPMASQIPVGRSNQLSYRDSEFFFVPCSCHCWKRSSSLFITELKKKNLPSLLFTSYSFIRLLSLSWPSILREDNSWVWDWRAAYCANEASVRWKQTLTIISVGISNSPFTSCFRYWQKQKDLSTELHMLNKQHRALRVMRSSPISGDHVFFILKNKKQCNI